LLTSPFEPARHYAQRIHQRPAEVFQTAFAGSTEEGVWWLREFVWDLYPKTNELIYDNYNAVALAWSLPIGRRCFCSIAVNTGVRFGFNWGSKIADPKGILEGEGSQYKSIKIMDVDEFPKGYMKKIVKGRYHYSLTRVKKRRETPAMERHDHCKIHSPVKRRPGKKS